MNEYIRLLDIANELGFEVFEYDRNVDFETHSPEGHDFIIMLEIDEDIDTDKEPKEAANCLIEELARWINNYDVSYEAYIWLDIFGHGKNGAPYDMRDVYLDMEWCKCKAEEMYTKWMKGGNSDEEVDV